MPLHVIIVGAGIAGLSAAIALRNAGHDVEIYEQSRHSSETGAAINVCPNASRILLPWGLDADRATMVACSGIYSAQAESLKVALDAAIDFEKVYGAPFLLSHRVDLHSELKLLATQEDGMGKPAKIVLDSKVINVDPESGTITLADQSTRTGDVVVAADGVHSIFSELVTQSAIKAAPTGMSAFRFLIDTDKIMNDEETKSLLEGRNELLKIFIGQGGDRRLVWYPCRSGKVQNFVMIHPENEQTRTSEDWKIPADQESLLKECTDFHPSLLAVCRKATDLNVWKLIFRSPISPWYKSRLVLVGDAAHPMLPHQGQGGAQSVEDAAALGAALTGLDTGDLGEIKTRLDAYQTIRRKRASAIQIFSNAGQDEPDKIKEAVKDYVDGDVPSNPMEFHRFNFGYDVWEHCRETLASRA